MPPASPVLPDHFALRSIIVGNLLAMLWFHDLGHGWHDCALLVSWSLPVESDGATGLAMLPWRCVSTTLFVFVTMLLASSCGVGFAFFILHRRLTRWLAAPLTVVAQFTAALPVIGLSWFVIATLVNILHLPVESLIPYIPPPERDSGMLAAGRLLWSWLVPMWTLALPLTGFWFAMAADSLRRLQPLPFQTALQSRGIDAEAVVWNHWFKLGMQVLRARWHFIGMIGFAWAIFVEDTFGLPGWGAFTARCVRENNVGGVASSMVAAAWMVTLWHLLSWPFRRGIQTVPLLSAPTPRATWWAVIILFSTLLLVLGIGSATPVINDLLLPWLAGLLPQAAGNAVLQVWPPLLDDVHSAGMVVGMGMLHAIVIGWLLALVARVRALPRLLISDTLLSGAFTATIIVLAAADHRHEVWFWPALALGLQGGVRVRDAATHLRQSAPMQASRIAGAGAFARWWRHAVPAIVFDGCGWAMQSMGIALLWMVLARSLMSASKTSVGSMLADARNASLTHSEFVTHPTWLVALAVLCFWRLSRVLVR